MLSRQITIGLTVLLAALAASARAQTTVYVDANADQTPHDGSDWCHAYLEVYTALDVATNGDEIRVADGTYLPDTTSLTNPREATFQSIDGVTLEGGYAGCGDGGDVRDVAVYETILSGDIGTSGVTSDNSYHVVTGSGTDETAVLDGFTITGGRANSSSGDTRYGGGMFNYMGSPKVANCTFSGNSASSRGGGMYNDVSSPTLTDCTFSGNSAGSGGGMYNLFHCSPTVTNCAFIGNSASSRGGGMCSFWRSSPKLTNCTFIGNSASSRGGGMYNEAYSSPKLTNCTFSGNSVDNDGGGMYNFVRCSPTVTNCAFIGNSADQNGGGMYNEDLCHPAMTNCTFCGNSASDLGGGTYGFDSSPTVANCVLWGNAAPTGSEIYDDTGSTTTATYSCIRGGWPGVGNIATDPMLGPDLHLRAGSPCINAGNNAAVPADVADLDGDGNTTEKCPLDLHGLPRFCRTTGAGLGSPPVVDMGAYERYVRIIPGPPPPPAPLEVTPMGSRP